MRQPSGWRTRPRSTSLAAALSVAVALTGACGGEQPVVPVRIGEPLPHFQLTTLDGARIDSRDLFGKTLLLNFWATWCAPCRAEIPVLERISRHPDLRVVGASLDQYPAAVPPFAERQDMSYELLMSDQPTFERLDGLGVPYTLIVDAEGVLRRLFRGPVSENSLRDVLLEVGVDLDEIEVGEELDG